MDKLVFISATSFKWNLYLQKTYWMYLALLAVEIQEPGVMIVG